MSKEKPEKIRLNAPGIELNLLNDEIVRLEQQNKRYREALNIIRNVTEEAIRDIDSGMKVQGLEYIVKVSDNLLEESE